MTEQATPPSAPEAQQTETTGADTQPAAESKPDPQHKIHVAFARAKQEALQASRERDEARKESAAVNARLAELEAKWSRYAEAEALREKDPLGAAEKLGFKYGDLTKAALTKPKADPTREAVEPLRAEVEQLKAREAEREKSAAAASKAAEHRQAREIVAQRLDATKDKYPLLTRAGIGDAIASQIIDHWERTGEALDLDQVAASHERYLGELNQKLTGSPNAAADATPGQQSAALQETPPKTATQPTERPGKSKGDGPSTLTNGHAASVASASAKKASKKPADIEKDRIARATRALERRHASS